jgi:hypothetical protein
VRPRRGCAWGAAPGGRGPRGERVDRVQALAAGGPPQDACLGKRRDKFKARQFTSGSSWRAGAGASRPRRRLGLGTCNVLVRDRPPYVEGIGKRVPHRRGQGVRPGERQRRTGGRPLMKGRRVPWPWPQLRLERAFRRLRSREPYFLSDFYPRRLDCKPAVPQPGRGGLR